MDFFDRGRRLAECFAHLLPDKGTSPQHQGPYPSPGPATLEAYVLAHANRLILKVVENPLEDEISLVVQLEQFL